MWRPIQREIITELIFFAHCLVSISKERHIKKKKKVMSSMLPHHLRCFEYTSFSFIINCGYASMISCVPNKNLESCSNERAFFYSISTAVLITASDWILQNSTERNLQNSTKKSNWINSFFIWTIEIKWFKCVKGTNKSKRKKKSNIHLK